MSFRKSNPLKGDSIRIVIQGNSGKIRIRVRDDEGRRLVREFPIKALTDSELSQLVNFTRSEAELV